MMDAFHNYGFIAFAFARQSIINRPLMFRAFGVLRTLQAKPSLVVACQRRIFHSDPEEIGLFGGKTSWRLAWI